MKNGIRNSPFHGEGFDSELVKRMCIGLQRIDKARLELASKVLRIQEPHVDDVAGIEGLAVLTEALSSAFKSKQVRRNYHLHSKANKSKQVRRNRR